MMAKTFEDKIIKVIEDHEKKNKINIIEVSVLKTKRIGFHDNSEIKINYYTQ